jgi:hypothetical protein
MYVVEAPVRATVIGLSMQDADVTMSVLQTGC